MPLLLSRSVSEVLRDTLRQLESTSEQQESASMAELRRQIVLMIAELHLSKDEDLPARATAPRQAPLPQAVLDTP